jgi:hypothetical protein
VEIAGVILADGRAALNPIAGIHVADAEPVVDRRVMDVAADDAISPVALRLGYKRLLIVADQADGAFDALLRPIGEGPVGQSEETTGAGSKMIGRQQKRIGPIAQSREPGDIADDHVEPVAMHDKQATAVGGLMNHLLGDLDAAIGGADEVAQELVVIAWKIDDPGALPRLAEKLLQHVVVALRPEPGPPQSPAVDDIADQVDRLGIVVAEEIEDEIGPAAGGAEVEVREKKAAKPTNRAVKHYGPQQIVGFRYAIHASDQ